MNESLLCCFRDSAHASMVFAAILARAWLKILRRYLKGQEEEELR